MSSLLFSIVAAFGLLLFAVVALGIGALLTGRVRLHKRCGSRPSEEKCSKKARESCTLCGGNNKDKE